MDIITILFTLVIFVFFILGVLGLIKPSIVGMSERGEAVIVLIFIILIVSIVFFSSRLSKLKITPDLMQGNKINIDNENNQYDRVREITIEQLFERFRQNEFLAKKLFKDQKLLVTGVVENIQYDLIENIVITLQAGGECNFLLPQAILVKNEKSKSKKLEKGKSVKLLCVGGSEIGGMIMLNNCKIKS